jgi:hypothetical protein
VIEENWPGGGEIVVQTLMTKRPFGHPLCQGDALKRKAAPPPKSQCRLTPKMRRGLRAAAMADQPIPSNRADEM